MLTACGASGSAGHSSSAALASYLAQVEPIRLGVNRLLERADPILSAFHARRLSRLEAAHAMDRLERRFAAYTVAIVAIQPQAAMLARLHGEYAQTYVLEDAYLSALVAGLHSGTLSGLPDTQATQRAAIIRWRTGLTVLAHATGLRLPEDLQQAGRGEIAPAALGAS